MRSPLQSFENAFRSQRMRAQQRLRRPSCRRIRTSVFATMNLTSMANRRRSTMVFADLVESDRLMRQHELDAIERWRGFVAEARDHVLPACGVINMRMGGDALLMEFANGQAAVRAAFELHRCIESVNVGRSDTDTMQLRIGVHTADVVVDQFEAYGIGVNFAARLASIAAPAQTLVSATARDEMVDGVHAVLQDLGERYVKHLREPVRVFAARRVGATADAAHRVPLPNADDLRPVLAVVPFVAMPADPTHDALGHAMADELISTLARHAELRVLSRVSTAALRGSDIDVQSVRGMLGADYLVTGRFYSHAERVRLNVELCELRTGEVLWSGSAQADVAALFAGTDELIPHVVTNISQRVVARELTRVRSLPMDTLASYTLYLGATGLMNSLVRGDFDRAQPLLEHLVERHPRQAAPHAVMARWHVFRTVQGWTSNPQHEGQLAHDHARRAMDIDSANPLALSITGLTCMNVNDDVDGAKKCFLAALAADPQDALTWAFLSAAHSHADEHDAACASSAHALALSPLDPNRFLLEAYAAMTQLGAGRYEEAASAARSSLRHHMLHAPSHRLFIAALWMAGEQVQARLAAQQFLQAYPHAKVGGRLRKPGSRRPSWAGVTDSALLAAGLPL